MKVLLQDKLTWLSFAEAIQDFSDFAHFLFECASKYHISTEEYFLIEDAYREWLISGEVPWERCSCCSRYGSGACVALGNEGQVPCVSLG